MGSSLKAKDPTKTWVSFIHIKRCLLTYLLSTGTRRHEDEGWNNIHFFLANWITWKFLCTQVTNGSFWPPFARPVFGPFAIFSGGDELSASLFVACPSFSSMSTSSLSKKFKNSWASYMSSCQIRVNRSGWNLNRLFN